MGALPAAKAVVVNIQPARRCGHTLLALAVLSHTSATKRHPYVGESLHAGDVQLVYHMPVK